METASSSRTLEVTVLSGDNLLVDRNPAAGTAFVVVRAESINSLSTGMASPAKGEGGQFSWNEKFLVDMPPHARSITFEVKNKTDMGVVKNVGVARIAVSDFLGGGSVPPAEGGSQLLTYRLRNWEGRPSGEINFEVKILECSSSSVGKPAASMTEKVSSCGFQMRASMAHQRNCNGFIIGVPICWNWNNYTRSHF